MSTPVNSASKPFRPIHTNRKLWNPVHIAVTKKVINNHTLLWDGIKIHLQLTLNWSLLSRKHHTVPGKTDETQSASTWLCSSCSYLHMSRLLTVRNGWPLARPEPTHIPANPTPPLSKGPMSRHAVWHQAHYISSVCKGAVHYCQRLRTPRLSFPYEDEMNSVRVHTRTGWIITFHSMNTVQNTLIFLGIS